MKHKGLSEFQELVILVFCILNDTAHSVSVKIATIGKRTVSMSKASPVDSLRFE